MEADALISRRAVRAHFSRAAQSYTAAAALQQAVEDQLLEALDALKTPPKRVLDVGCGPGRSSAALRRNFPEAQVIALDFALPMLQQLPKALTAPPRWGGRINPFAKHTLPVQRVAGDAMQLPIAGNSLDLLFSSLCIQWCQDLPRLFGDWRRVMQSDGLLLFSSFGPDTLMELRQAWRAVDGAPHVNHFFDMHDVGDALLRAGFRDPVLRTERFSLSYPDVAALLHELKAIGASNAMSARRKGLGGKSALAQMRANYPLDADNRATATYEVVFAQAFAPPPGAPIRLAGAEIASVPLSAIKRAQRRSP
jgi:malonyl-CoA O-methyltransferase